MYRKIIKNDMRRSKLITIVITGFILLAALFTALAVSLLVNLFGAIDNLMTDTKAPQYTQMHSGDINRDRLEKFVLEHKEIEDLQISEFLNIDGMDIVIGGHSLSDSVQDNGFAVQNETFDFLLDLNNQILRPQDGEVYVPVYYKKEGIAKPGDTISIHGVTFTVAGFLRDSQMNVSMASAKRFLVSENDYEKIRGYGKMEYMIEFMLSEGVNAAQFQSLYINSGLEDNGPIAHYGLVRMMNGIEDGVMIAMLLLVSILILIVAFLCVRFTLIAKVEEDYREIGVLKAVGLRVSDIKKLYIAKYSVIAFIGCGLGFLLSLLFQEPMLENIRLYMGRSGKESLAALLGFAGACFVFAIVILYVSGVLRRFRKISASQAIRYGAPLNKAKASKGLSLQNNRLFSTSAFLGMKDVMSRKGLYLIMLLVLIISCFIMVVPQNIYNTIADRSFMTYMGIGECDLRVDINLTDQIPEKAQDIGQMLYADKTVKERSILTCWMFDMPVSDGSTGHLKVELGDHTVFPLTYSVGREPRKKNEIALSTMNGDELEKGIGDTIELKVDGQVRELVVCGLYSDITNGGLTAKATFDAENGKVLWSTIPVALKDASNIDQMIAEYKNTFSYAKVSKVEDYLDQTLGTTLDATQKVSSAMIFASSLLIFLITVLFMKMLVMKDRYQISVLKSLGFTSKAIRHQYMIKSGVVLLLGAGIGTILANTLGELAGVGLMSTFGVTTFHFKINALFAYLISPLVIAICVYVATLLGITDIKNMKVSEYIKE